MPTGRLDIPSMQPHPALLGLRVSVVRRAAPVAAPGVETAGHATRVAAIFANKLGRWLRGEVLAHAVA